MLFLKLNLRSASDFQSLTTGALLLTRQFHGVGAAAVGTCSTAAVGAVARTVVEGREFRNVKHLCFALLLDLLAFEVVKLCYFANKVFVDRKRDTEE